MTIRDLKGLLDFSVELMLNENSDTSIIKYTIKIISKKYLGLYAKKYYVKHIHHLVLLYPYLANLLDDYLFQPHNISKDDIKLIATDMYESGIKKKFYESCSQAIYWAIKYDFTLDSVKIKEDSIASLDCIFMTISFCYDRKINNTKYLKEYKDQALYLKKNDYDRYWLFIYEVLTAADLIGNYKIMKENKITFIKDKFL